MNDESSMSNAHAYFGHLLRYQKIYLCALLILLSALTLFSNHLQEKPFLIGGESYFFLSSAQQELPYHPLTLLFRVIPDQIAFLFPPLLSLGVILLFYILTPASIFTSLAVSSYSLFLLLVLLGVNVLLLGSKKKYLALLPFLLASWIDIFSSLLLLIGLAVYFLIVKKSQGRFSIIILISIAAVMVLNAALLNSPFFLGPFTMQDRGADLISDLGSFSGVGVFALLLAIIGLITGWQKNNISIILPALVVFFSSYLFNAQTIFFLSLLIVILAAVGFVDLLGQNWRLSSLRNAVLLLLLLGISFSTVAYLGRLSEYSPTALDQKSLEWIKRNTDEEAVVLSAPENSYYVSYFAQRKPAFSLHRRYQQDYRLSQDIFSAFYIDELFPLLEENNISIIYVSEDMKRQLPAQQEFLFLLQNERFKLLYFTEEAEVWSFDEAKQ